MDSHTQKSVTDPLSVYRAVIETDRRLIRGETLADTEKASLAKLFMAARSTDKQKRRFYEGVRFPGNTDASGRHMYPEFFIPPYNGGKKLQTVLGQTPKTYIFSANMYELEILRLLTLLSLDNAVSVMVEHTLERLRTTCFASENDGVGECFDTSLVALRFLGTCAPSETDWMRSRIASFYHRYPEKKRPWFSKWYFWLCLSELPDEVALPEIMRYRDEVLPWLTKKSCVMNSENDRAVHPVLLCMLRNMLARLPEFANIKTYQPYIDPRDGRLRFDIKGMK
jgi:hypothetical protein